MYTVKNILNHSSDLELLKSEIGACRACEAHLPLGPRPIVQLSSNARILIASQAPGSKAHVSGVPFSDASGDTLREWLGVTRAEFYTADNFAVVPLGLCYPGKATGGDSPPRPECAPLWHKRILQTLSSVELTILVGGHAVSHKLGAGLMTDRVRDFESYLPNYFPLPHPSWRSRFWMTRNPWFEAAVLPRLKQEIRKRL